MSGNQRKGIKHKVAKKSSELNTVEEAVDAIRNGEIVIVVAGATEKKKENNY